MPHDLAKTSVIPAKLFHVKHQLQQQTAMHPEQIDPHVRARLARYVELLERWKGVTNLISPSAMHNIWVRHIPDGLRLLSLFPEKTRWLDFGSGAGLPGIILGCCLAETSGARVYCVDSDGRKCAFLRHVARELNIPVKVLNARAESIPTGEIEALDMITARAFASVTAILDLADPYLEKGVRLILPRGEASRSEIDDIDAVRYEHIEHDGLASGNGFFLEIWRRAGSCDGS